MLWVENYQYLLNTIMYLIDCKQIKHQYKLTNEQGPPHKKKFTVTLQLGNEEYDADAMSIKKAQHAAAALALKKTNYKQPFNKIKLKTSGHYSNYTIKLPTVVFNKIYINFCLYYILYIYIYMFIDNITPTVELNALAMKRGEQTVYTVIETPQYVSSPNTIYNGFRTEMYSHTRTPYTNFSNMV